MNWSYWNIFNEFMTAQSLNHSLFSNLCLEFIIRIFGDLKPDVFVNSSWRRTFSGFKLKTEHEDKRQTN
jgi:hypothetical protein